jgi:predicted Zn-dependent peptidase
MTENNYHKTILENGLRVVTEKMPEVRSIAMGVLVNAGPRTELPGKSGLAHLVEHAMFQGTSNRQVMEISRLMDMAGGQMGGFTTRDYTCYVATVLDDYLTYALDLLGDILLNSTFPVDNLEREKRAILREIDAGFDMPDKRARTLMQAFTWPDHPLGRSVAGCPETVNRLSREDVIYFVHEHYLPDRIIIAAAGNVEHEDFTAQVRDAFWRMLGQSKPSHYSRPEFNAGVSVEHMSVSQTYFTLGIRAYPYTHPQRYGLHLLNSVLGCGISSRLFRRMREERGLVYDIGSEYQAYGDDGILVIEGSTASKHLMQVLDLTLRELDKLINREEPVSEEELWRAKMQIRGQHLIAAESTNTRVSRLATQEFYFGRHIPIDEILSQIEAVDIQMLQRLAEELLTSGRRQLTVAVVGPEAPEHYGPDAIEALLADFKLARRR